MHRHTVQTTLSALFVVALGCAASADPAVAPQQQGSLQMALTEQHEDGTVYRLTSATLIVTGEHEQNFDASDADVFRTDLDPGSYTLELAEGWSLEAERDGEHREVAATLLTQSPMPFDIAAGELTQLTLSFRIQEDAEPGMLEVGLNVGGPDASIDCDRLVINELDYDQEGTDEREFIELFNAGSCSANLTASELVLHNGASPDSPYAVVALEGAGSVAAGAYLVVGSALALDALAADVPGIELATSLQNGPDGVSLRRDGQQLDAVSYGGPLPGVTEQSSAPDDPGAGSLSRCPNGGDTGDGATDFVTTETVTPGTANDC